MKAEMLSAIRLYALAHQVRLQNPRRMRSRSMKTTEPKPLTVRTLIGKLLDLPASANDLPIIADGCDCEGEAVDLIVRDGSVLVSRYVDPGPPTKLPEEPPSVVRGRPRKASRKMSPPR